MAWITDALIIYGHWSLVSQDCAAEFHAESVEYQLICVTKWELHLSSWLRRCGEILMSEWGWRCVSARHQWAGCDVCRLLQTSDGKPLENL